MMGEEPLEVPPSSSAATQQSSSLSSHTPPSSQHHHQHHNHHHYPQHRPQQQQQHHHQHHHHHQNIIASQLQLLDQHSTVASELSWLSDQQTQQSERERALSRERIVNAYERANTQQQQQQPGTSSSNSSSAQVSSGTKSSNPSTPRRTRHRVDAGEPRGCFNTGNSIPNSLNHHHWGTHHHQRSNHFGSRFHPHFLPPGVVPPQQQSGFINQFSSAPPPPPPPPPHHPLQGSTRRSPPGDSYYFQPMKMLSEFISSASAVAAAQAAQHNTTTSPKPNSRENQLLLREMLCKSAAAMAGTQSNTSPLQQTTTSSTNKLNNNNIQKYEYDEIGGHQENSNSSSTKSIKSSKLDGMIGLMMDKLSSAAEEPEVDASSNQQTESKVSVSMEVEKKEESHDSEDADAAGTMMMGDDESVLESSENTSASKSTNSAAADLLNNNTSSLVQPQQQQAQGQSGGQTRNKRKKYQPQRSDLVECSDLGVGNGGIDDLEEFTTEHEDMIKTDDKDEEEIEENNRRITRSQQRRIQRTTTADLQDPDNPDEEEENNTPTDFSTELKSTRMKRKLPEEFLSDIDEDEAMLLRQVASGSRSSAATTNPDDVESMIQEYENEEEEQEAMINDDLQHEHEREQEIGSRRTLPVVRNLMRTAIQHRANHPNTKEAPLTRQLLTSERPTSTPPTNSLEKTSILRPNLQTPRHPTPSPNDLPNGLNNPASSFLQQWKENLKTTLMSHINELVDAQFSLLLGGGMIPPGLALPPHLQQRMLQQQPDHERRSLRESNNSRLLQEPKVEQKRTPPPPQQQQQQQQQQQSQSQSQQNPPRSHTPRDQQKPLLLNGGTVLNTEKLSMMGSPPMNDVKKLPVGRATNSERSSSSSEYPGMPPRFPFMQNNERSMIPGGIQQNGKPSHFSSALVGLSNHHLQQQAVAAAVAANAVAAAAGIENMFDNDGALSLVVGNRGAGAAGAGAPGINDIVHGNVTPRKKRHKVTDTRLTPRAVSRLLGQVDSTPTSSTSPLYDHHGPSSSPQGSPHHHSGTPIEPRSILQNGTPPPHREQTRERSTPQNSTQSQQDPPRSIFNTFHPPGSAPVSAPFFHPAALAAAAAAGHPIHPSQLARLDSPPMSNSLLHPALQNPSEYVERLREMSMEREHHQERNTRVGSDNVVVRDRGDHHHHASLREYPSVRGLRDRGAGGGGIMLSNDVLDLIGRSGSAGGSDSGGESGSGAFELGGGGGGMYCHTTSTLTPMHLRKAKLMFFWTRYPSSAVIKMYFPDIKFNKNNTAQLVKWFSNFREFYYIQMEKYARQALSEGVKQAEDLVVTTDSELYRVLNLHYNRNNHIEVPSNFRYVVEQTLREFFKSVQAGKDSEQSWKKAIYKIIARLDDPVPEYFKSPNFLEQLE